ncbi:hypothetical protein GGX14DRAFT_399930 [Mycena pura]|uniref:Tc1-like transposase DDE domain-containing protein n=1 Tax=Mycena pura TaxID=153505 RepID=A0AAD6V3V5_9AGAR|nr:hypothetical protein GGX14DRAFT_399930 [Mycena pura]
MRASGVEDIEQRSSTAGGWWRAGDGREARGGSAAPESPRNRRLTEACPEGPNSTRLSKYIQIGKVGGKSHGGQRACIADTLALRIVEGSVDGEEFFDFVLNDVLPQMNAFPADDSVLIMDNCRIHKSEAVRDACLAAVKAYLRHNWREFEYSQTSKEDLAFACFTAVYGANPADLHLWIQSMDSSKNPSGFKAQRKAAEEAEREAAIANGPSDVKSQEPGGYDRQLPFLGQILETDARDVAHHTQRP